MILACPACSTRFIVDPKAIGASGRMVRCSQCAHTWFQEPAADLPKTVTAAAAAPAFSYDEAESRPIPEGSNLPAMPRPKSGGASGASVGWAVLILVLAGLGGGFYFGRDRLVQLWPPVAKLYAAVGMPVAPVSEGLDFVRESLKSSRRTESGVVVVEGTVVNPTDRPRQVPMLRATALTDQQQRLKDWLFPIDAKALMAGEQVSFRVELTDVPPGSQDIEITFSEKLPD